jgi:AraC-like DNA-binding protein
VSAVIGGSSVRRAGAAPAVARDLPPAAAAGLYELRTAHVRVAPRPPGPHETEVDASLLPPAPTLAPLVRTYEVLEAPAAIERTLVPEPAVIFAFRYAGASWLVEGRGARETPAAAVTGLRLRARRMRTAAGGGVVLAKLQAAAAGAFVDGPLHRLFGETRPLAALVPPLEVERTLREVRAGRGDAERVAAVERFLLRRLERRRWRPDPAVEAAVQAILADPGGVRIAALAASLGLSVDGLERRFRRGVGASPKQLASIVRLRQAVAAAAAGPPLGALAAEAGYYDQAHFSRQFLARLGAAPGAFLARAEYCLDEPAAAPVPHARTTAR